MAEERHTHILELLPAYALDSLDEQDLIQVSEHLAGCAMCRAELQVFQPIVEQLPIVGLHQHIRPRRLIG